MAAATASDKLLEFSQWLISSFTSVLPPSCAKATWQTTAHSAHKATLFMYSPRVIIRHCLLTNYACSDYRDRLCRPYYWGLPEFYGTHGVLPGQRRSEDQSVERGPYPHLRAKPR